MYRIIIELILIALLAGILSYFYFAKAPLAQKITWGVNFSQMRAESLGIDWQKAYLAILQDLGVKNIKLHTQWDWVEGRKDEYYFKDIDWQINQAEKYGAKIIYVVGMKTGRWPECHLPDWADGVSKEQQQKEILEYVQKVVLRYKNNKAITAWQAENEPLFKFGICPWYDEEFFKKEVELIKSLDPLRPVIVTDSGEQSFWFKAAQIGDIVGVTMYRKVWVHITDNLGFYWEFPLPAPAYWHKAQIIKRLFGKEVINIELQAEPWVRDVSIDIPLKEQEKTMNLEQFKKNIDYAKKSGLNKVYFWGAEWWYWLKENQNKPDIWNEAKKIFKSQ
ncbi:MAG: glycoside hydrolase family 2 TIM barrel-domain containing protein [Patescibacteria group bacterium]